MPRWLRDVFANCAFELMQVESVALVLPASRVQLVYSRDIGADKPNLFAQELLTYIQSKTRTGALQDLGPRYRPLTSDKDTLSQVHSKTFVSTPTGKFMGMCPGLKEWRW